MQEVTNREHVVVIDVDDTLVMRDVSDPTDWLICPYDGTTIPVRRHNKHIKLLKDYHARGYYVIVWSAGGWNWARAVVDSLDLSGYVHHTMAKPVKYVDDLEAKDILGTRVYLDDKA